MEIAEKMQNETTGKDFSKRIFSDGERQAPIEVEEAEPSHLARYKFAQHFIKPTDKVLDAPCGSGYGTKLLSETAGRVYGVDIHQRAVEHAGEFFSSDKNSFVRGDMKDLQSVFPENNSFDLVVSFEGVEHVENQEFFLSEVKRLLKKDGKLIISTPRKPHGSPYHVREFSLDEFRELLQADFEVQQMFGQIYTDIFELSARQVDPDDYKRFNFIAICKPKDIQKI